MSKGKVQVDIGTNLVKDYFGEVSSVADALVLVDRWIPEYQNSLEEHGTEVLKEYESRNPRQATSQTEIPIRILAHLATHPISTRYRIEKDLGAAHSTVIGTFKELSALGLVRVVSHNRFRTGLDRIDYRLTTLGLHALVSTIWRLSLPTFGYKVEYLFEWFPEGRLVFELKSILRRYSQLPVWRLILERLPEEMTDHATRVCVGDFLSVGNPKIFLPLWFPPCGIPLRTLNTLTIDRNDSNGYVSVVECLEFWTIVRLVRGFIENFGLPYQAEKWPPHYYQTCIKFLRNIAEDNSLALPVWEALRSLKRDHSALVRHLRGISGQVFSTNPTPADAPRWASNPHLQAHALREMIPLHRLGIRF